MHKSAELPRSACFNYPGLCGIICGDFFRWQDSEKARSFCMLRAADAESSVRLEDKNHGYSANLLPHDISDGIISIL